AVLDLVAGHVKVGMLTWSIAAEHVRAGRLLALATTSGQRLPYRAEVPTLRELGHRDFVATTWYSLSGPAGLAPDIVESANREIVNALERPQLKRHIEQDAIETKPMSPAQDRALQPDLQNAFGDLFRLLRIECRTPLRRHVNVSDGECLALHHGRRSRALPSSTHCS